MADKKRRTARPAKSPHVSENMIAERAYNRWIARGCPISDGLEDWFAAQAELSAETPKRSALRRLSA